MENSNTNPMLPAQCEDITPKNAVRDGGLEWQISCQFHEIGGDRERETKKTFRSAGEAQAFFGGQVVKFTNMFGRSSNASIEQSESELLIHVDGVQIVKITYLAVPVRCA